MYIDTTPGSVPSKASSSPCLLTEGQTLPYLTGLNWFEILHRFMQFRSLLRQMQLGNSHNLLHMLNSSCKAVSSAVARVTWHGSRVTCIKRNPHSWIGKHNITSAVHMITRSPKEYTGFTEIPGRLGKAHLLGKWRFFSKLWWCCPPMDVTVSASNTFYGIAYLIWFHWIYCF